MFVDHNELSVLIAEDQIIVAMALAKELRGLGYNVIKFVKNGRDLIKEALLIKPDVIISDIRMDDNIDGVTALEIIVQAYSPIIIFISALSDKETIVRANRIKKSIYARKPIIVSEIHKQIQLLLTEKVIS